ncbi:MAG: hypothetical protein FIA92_15175 [Chloroflexi bacterium]|nr:hypothetical protein [Chloroflexota bacterium]
MTRQAVLTEDVLRLALAPDVDRRAPAQLVAAIAEEVRRTPQRSGVLAWRPSMQREARTRLTWALVAGGAIVALVVGALLAGSGRPQPPTLPSTLPAMVLPPLTVDRASEARQLAVGLDDAWILDVDERLWHGTSDGWTGPLTADVSGITNIAVLPDGRLVVSTDHGPRVREFSGEWTDVGRRMSLGLAVDSDGMIWTSESGDTVAWALAGYRETSQGWHRTPVDCPAGGLLVAAATDGSVWTGGIGYSGAAGLARLDGTGCEEVFVLDRLSHDVLALAAGPNGTVVAQMAALGVGNYYQEGDWTDVRTVFWDGSGWETLVTETITIRESLSLGRLGELYAARENGVWRLLAGRWHRVVAENTMVDLATAPDGTVWYATWFADRSLAVKHLAR